MAFRLASGHGLENMARSANLLRGLVRAARAAAENRGVAINGDANCQAK